MKTLIRYKLILIIGLIFMTSCEIQKEISRMPKDGDGNEYDTVVIGTQVWLKENLKTTKTKFGNPLTLDTEWKKFSLTAYCYYENNENHKDTYGALYNYQAVKVGAICPEGYHVPNRDDWNKLIEYSGGMYSANKIKEVGSNHWVYSNQGATNETDFTALPGGMRAWDGLFNGLNGSATWWISDAGCVLVSSEYIKFCGLSDEAGLSVRCVKNK